MHIEFYMDSNVSKNTFLHKFLKLGFTNFNYSIKNLLKENLLLAIDLYLQRKNLCINKDNLNETIAQKIILVHYQSLALCSQSESNKLLLSSKSTEYIYRSAVVFPLANYCQLTPENVALELVDCLYFVTKKSEIFPALDFRISLTNSAWIDFYLLPNSLKNWLEHPLILSKEKLNKMAIAPLTPISRDLFPLQYVHSRCCSWLRLGEQEGLIKLPPEKINWCNEEGDLWLAHEAEYRLIWQLLTVVDSWFEDSGKWSKLAFSLSEAFLAFEAECQFFGEVAQKTPNLAIARLGAIALVQFWLKKLLEEKLNLVALTEV